MLAQLMRDMQDPEIMREAQKMMQSPEFQEQMKQMAEHPHFKQAMKQTKDLMADPEKVKAVEEKMKVAVADGEKQLDAFKKAQKEVEDEKATKEGEKDEDKKDEKKPAATDDVDDLDIPNLNLS
uniref:STI1 domain-containing protein n=2 Tax=Grammatophora oceanica TaxID=210454 RepID=A0A7S1XZI6_9STRA|mmetsp:Transcript_11837/g.17386  ORF Transcript_11837/g.17386 Transcript_11837/m.17386 type:complete len:124 (+) Transcript_11837:176-547(+)